MLFIHGWTCNRTFFAPQLEHFAKRHRVVAVDLRGHGGSEAPQQAYSLSALADDVAWLSEQLGVRRPVLIGHSMGGVVALELLAARPDAACAVVLLDSPVAVGQATADSFAPFAASLRSENGRERFRAFCHGMFMS